MRVPLTCLYAPGDRPDRVGKAYESGADVVIIDLEDAVAPASKEAARTGLPDLVAGLAALSRDAGRYGRGGAHERGPGHESDHVVTFERPKSAPTENEADQVVTVANPGLQVRINAVGTPWHAADLETVVDLPREVALRLPKVESVDQVRRVCDVLPGRAVQLLLESALGIERAYELATCHPSIAGIGLGEADLRAELRVTGDGGLLWARSRVVVAAAAAGLPAPVMSVFANVADLDGLAESCRRGRELGFLGRAAIHPRQLDVIRAAFTPTADEVRLAKEVLAAATEADARGSGAVALPDGRFVDEAVVRQARRTVALAEPGV